MFWASVFGTEIRATIVVGRSFKTSKSTDEHTTEISGIMYSITAEGSTKEQRDPNRWREKRIVDVLLLCKNYG